MMEVNNGGRVEGREEEKEREKEGRKGKEGENGIISTTEEPKVLLLISVTFVQETF